MQTEIALTSLCVNERVYLVIARLSHSLGKVTVHQRLVDKDGLIYSLEKIVRKRYEKHKKMLNVPQVKSPSMT